MHLFGHLGIGSQLVTPWSKGLPLKWLFLGALLPDLIDKPLYYGLSILTGKSGAALGIISGTRTFGHTALFLLLLCIVCFTKKSKPLAAVVLGIGSHLLLDGVTSTVLGDPKNEFLQVVLWPYPHGLFPLYPFEDLRDHLSIWKRPFLIYCEALGAALLLRRYFLASV